MKMKQMIRDATHEEYIAKYGIRYQNGGGDCVWTASTIGAEDCGKWVVFSPCTDGIGEGATRADAIADAARAAGVTVEDFESDDNFDPVACDVQEDSILIGQVEEIEA